VFSIALLLASTENCKGIHYSLQTNATHLERRAVEAVEPASKKPRIEFDCSTATYETVTIQDFVYTHHCFPLEESWKDVLALEKVKKVISEISATIKSGVEGGKIIEPKMPFVFRAFNVPLDKIKVIIIGQDPTPVPGMATGLAFSLEEGADPTTCPSVFNILVELKWEGFDVGLTNGDLTPWVKQGVLLLNAALTIEQGKIGSHQKLWKGFTQLLVGFLSTKAPPSAWILWGNEAQKVQQFMAKSNSHYIKAGGHPSPRAATGFFGGNYFTCANDFLAKTRGYSERIDWSIPSVKREIEKC